MIPVRPHSKDILTCTAPNLDVYIHILNKRTFVGVSAHNELMIIPAVSYDLSDLCIAEKSIEESKIVSQIRIT